ncbi:uracil phosphoribosyltransferase [Peptococcus simiae]|uniref:Uracil phosphoribosyltransferase n=1 Tax=Peptococcus simiae TaxID=1643805 RepID=A0ABW9GYE1_9FIRM
MGFTHIFDHPLIHHKISFLRDKTTSTPQFRQIVNEIAMLMAYEISRDFPLVTTTVETPLATTECKRLAERSVVLVPILRAGLGMLEGFQFVLPSASVGHIGMARNEETLEPEPYYHKLPGHVTEAHVIVLDPMLATGGSACNAIDFLKSQGATDITFAAILGTDQGLQKVHEAHPDVRVYLAEKDPVLNEHGYIVPGLGDAGDRIFGTVDAD